jgi:hypothetical protein
MAIKQFYLLGESPSRAKEIEVPLSLDEGGLRDLVASHFSIVESKGKWQPRSGLNPLAHSSWCNVA